MGGAGSGNFIERRNRKDVVEDCLSLDANLLMRRGGLRAGVYVAGEWRWDYPNGTNFSAAYTVDARDAQEPLLWLSYSWAWRSTGEADSVGFWLRLAVTQPFLGGVRWWFLCPGDGSGKCCGRRVGKLYLPPRARLFACRHCHQLTYTSRQQSGKFDGLFRRIAGDTGHEFDTVKREMLGLGK